MMISIVFAGTSAFAVPSLRLLAGDKRFSIALVITQPDRPVGRKQELTPSPVKVAAQELGLEIAQPENINAEFTQLAARIPQPDFFVVIAYGQILKDPVLAWPRIDPINVHGSLLPRWRGASPVHHAILAGDAETGVTVQRMARELDAGPVLSQATTPIAPRETLQSLHDRLAEMGAPLLAETLAKPLIPKDQDESGVTVCRKLAREDGKVTTETQTAQEIDRRVRALTPWPGVTMTIEGTELKILETSLEPTKGSIPVSCRDWTILHVVTVQPAGKKPMRADEWKRGKGTKGTRETNDTKEKGQER